MKKILYLVTAITLLTSCNSNNSSGGNRFLPNGSGSAGELIIVIDNKLWESPLGDTLKFTLAQSQVALPQPEPLFNLINVPPSAFNNIFQIHRNIIYFNISPEIKEPSITYEKEKWARYQLIVYMNAPSKESMLEYFSENKYKVISKLLETERERTIQVNITNEERSIRSKIQTKHKISMVFPHNYKLDVDSTSFVWISHTEPEVDQGILIYYYPYLDPSDFEKDNLIKKRNEILEQFVHGSSPGSYMTTEDLVPVYYNSYYRKNGLYIAEMRGLWKLEKGFMGGPFISHSTVDTVYDRIVTVEGYVFAPRKEKRNLLRQVEAILHTLEIKK